MLALLTAFPVIGQDQTHSRSCRPGLAALKHDHNVHGASAMRRAGTAAGNKYTGDRRQLVVMVSFADQGFKGDSAQTMTQWGKIFNTRYYSEDQFYGSVYDYFFEQSYGQFKLSFDLYYVTGDSMSRYSSTHIDDENSKYLVQDVVTAIKGQISDWTPYDWDDDGYVDQLLIVYSGKGQNDGGSTKTIWPHQWWLSEHENSSAIKVESGGKEFLIDAYCCIPELSGDGSYGSFGTLCHEYSHCLGLPDFYDGSTRVVGTWDLMDNGNYNGAGFRPCGYSAYERAFMGWLTLEELTGMESVVGLPALSTQPKAFIVRNDAHPDEYYIIENRQKAGWDEKLPGSGIVIFHVDYDQEIFSIGQPNDKTRQRYTIFPANNKPVPSADNMKGWAYPYNGNNSLTDTSEPAAELFNLSADSTLYMNKPITEMAVIRGMAQFKFCYPVEDGIVPVRMESVEGGLWFTIDGRLLPGVPERQGLYIHEGKVVLVR